MSLLASGQRRKANDQPRGHQGNTEVLEAAIALLAATGKRGAGGAITVLPDIPPGLEPTTEMFSAFTGTLGLLLVHCEVVHVDHTREREVQVPGLSAAHNPGLRDQVEGLTRFLDAPIGPVQPHTVAIPLLAARFCMARHDSRSC